MPPLAVLPAPNEGVVGAWAPEREGGALSPVAGVPPRPRPPGCGAGPPSPPPGTPAAALMTSHSPRWFIGSDVSFSVIGSLYFFRRKRPCTRTSRLGG